MTRPAADYLQQRLEAENLTHSDIIQEDFIDTYSNLVLKSLALLRRVVADCEGREKERRCPRFVLKTDDDIYINLSVLWREARRSEERYLLLGALICRSKPTRDKSSKWFVPGNEYASTTYPPFLSGTAYLMSRDTVRELHKVTKYVTTFPLEDVFVTGILAKKAGIRPQDHPGFSYRHRDLDPCSVRKTISTHKVEPREMEKVWRDARRRKEECSRGEEWAPRNHWSGTCTSPKDATNIFKTHKLDRHYGQDQFIRHGQKRQHLHH